MYFRYFSIIAPGKRHDPSFEHLKMLCAKVSRNWHGGSSEDFQISLMYQYFCILVLHVSPFVKGHDPLFEQESHGSHHSPETQFQSINTCAQSYHDDYTMVLCAKFG